MSRRCNGYERPRTSRMLFWTTTSATYCSSCIAQTVFVLDTHGKIVSEDGGSLVSHSFCLRIKKKIDGLQTHQQYHLTDWPSSCCSHQLIAYNSPIQKTCNSTSHLSKHRPNMAKNPPKTPLQIHRRCHALAAVSGIPTSRSTHFQACIQFPHLPRIRPN